MPPSVLAGRIVGPGEPAWTQDDTDLALALVGLEQATCDGCGRDREESMSAQHEFDFESEPVRCHACAARDRAARAKSEDKSWDDSGVRWVTSMREARNG